MKKFVIKVVSYLLIGLAIIILPSVLIDPFNVFHWKKIRNVGGEPNKNFIKTEYIIHNPEKFNAFLFGSSRVGAIHVENVDSLRMYNMSYSEGIPKENLDNIKTFIKHGVSIKTVLLGVDNFSYTTGYEEHTKVGLRAPYEYLNANKLDFVKLYLDPTVALQSIKVTFGPGKVEGYEAFYDYGWWCDYDKESSIDWASAEPATYPEYYMDETLEDIKELVKLCDANGIELIVFVNPMNHITYRSAVTENNFMEFYERLAEITPYYNFGGLNDITTNNEYYLDTSHYKAFVGDIMLDAMFKGKVDENLYSQGFGWIVNKDNFEDFRKIIEVEG